MKDSGSIVSDTSSLGKRNPQSSRQGRPFVRDSWLPLRLITAGVFAILCVILAIFAADFSSQFRLWTNTFILAGAVVFGLLGIFLKPNDRGWYLSNKTFGVVSVLLVLTLVVLNPYDFLKLTLTMKWRSYLFVIMMLFLQALLAVVYMELLWALASFQEEPYPFEDERSHRLRKLNLLHYILFLPFLMLGCALFIVIISIFTTYFLFTSQAAFLNSLTSGSVYPLFIVGMIALAVLLVILGVEYLWYRFIRTEPEKFEEEEVTHEEKVFGKGEEA